VKDMLFQKKYSLSHTQMDLMAYFVNLAYWTIIVEGYCVIATKKIMSDLPEMGQKTIEASLKKLKEVGLIETTIVEVKVWNGNPRIWGLKLTEKGKELEAKIEQLTVDTEEKSEEGRNGAFRPKPRRRSPPTPSL